MTTSRKTSTAKKTTGTKKATSRAKGVKKAPHLTWRFYAVTIGIFLVAVATVIVAAYLAASVVAKQTNQTRLDRINTIYASLELGDEYRVENANVFGDKRPYDWGGDAGKGRTHSSAVTYIHGDTVSNTVAELDAKIKAAGFTFVDEPYPGSVFTQYHYKSADGEYIRLNVESKQYWDAVVNAAAMDEEPSDEVYAMDKNAGPARVTIKVNLDDNNE